MVANLLSVSKIKDNSDAPNHKIKGKNQLRKEDSLALVE